MSFYRSGAAPPQRIWQQRARLALGWPVSERDIDELAKFIITNNLALDPPGGDAKAFTQQMQHSRRGGLIGKLVHNYLFFKIPLVQPQRILTATLPIVNPLFSKSTAIALVILGCSGLYLTSRQWDTFVSTFMSFLNLEGALLSACVLFLVKALHELGHAYAAARAGVRVTSIGVAFMLMTPMLYTDVTDAWRLRDRRAKLAIDVAGIAVEIALAAIALFLWAFLPDGALRSAAFLIATTSLFMGLAINLNPLMKFDGYHILADSWGIANLQTRSNALAIWRLREFLFGLGHKPPEAFEPRRQAMLIGYAITAWLYRMALFFGIALMVYHAFFKVLGVLLFTFEIVWFMLLPTAREINAWWNMRHEIFKKQRYIYSSIFLFLALAGLFAPWNSTIKAQGLAISDYSFRFFAPRPAQLASIAVTDGQHVAAGDVILTLVAPDLEHEVAQSSRRIASTEARLASLTSNAADRADRLILEGGLAKERANLSGLQGEQSRLIVTAPRIGVVKDLDPGLKPGQWTSETTAMARLVGEGQIQAVAYIDEQDVRRLKPGSDATFIPDDILRGKIKGRIIEIAPVGTRALEYTQLATVFGGSVPSDRTPDGKIKPRQGRHLVRIALDSVPLTQSQRGIVHLSGQRESIAAAMLRRILQVLIRESSA